MTGRPDENFRIEFVRAREILDSGGNPTLEVGIVREGGAKGRADVPSGRSRVSHEAYELRDGASRYVGRGVLTAAKNVNEIIGPNLKGTEVGAIVYGYSLTDVAKAGIDPVESLQKHDSANVFRKIEGAICTGNTMTNLMDLLIVHVRG